MRLISLFASLRKARVLRVAAVLVAAFLVLQASSFAQKRDVLVYAAASLKNALDDITKEYQAEKGVKVTVSLAASSALAKQIENGAPGDIFISADLDWMDYLASRKLIKPETRKNLLGNKLVLVASSSSDIYDVRPKPGFALAKALKGGRLAMGDVNAVPAGKYGKTSLEKLGVWPSVQKQIAQAESVRAALALVARGEAPLGIVYQTDAQVEPSVRIVGLFPENSHAPIIYPMALLAGSTSPEATSFASYLQSRKARLVFEKYGFEVLK